MVVGDALGVVIAGGLFVVEGVVDMVLVIGSSVVADFEVVAATVRVEAIVGVVRIDCGAVVVLDVVSAVGVVCAAVVALGEEIAFVVIVVMGEPAAEDGLVMVVVMTIGFGGRADCPLLTADVVGVAGSRGADGVGRDRCGSSSSTLMSPAARGPM